MKPYELVFFLKNPHLHPSSGLGGSSQSIQTLGSPRALVGNPEKKLVIKHGLVRKSSTNQHLNRTMNSRTGALSIARGYSTPQKDAGLCFWDGSMNFDDVFFICSRFLTFLSLWLGVAMSNKTTHYSMCYIKSQNFPAMLNVSHYQRVSISK